MAGKSTCPTWCVDGHELPQDDAHMGEVQEVELSAHPYTVTVLSGESRTYTAPVLVNLATDSGPGTPYITLVNHDGIASDRLTADEADKLAALLQELAANLRRG
jgi:hypothetical protein